MKILDKKINAIILAAGLGTRLRPLTNDIPKPLLPIGDRFLLENIILNIKNAGIRKIAVNTHHLPEKIKNFISNSPYADSVRIFHEKKILGTGGPIVNAKALLSEGDFFVLHNGDILTDVNIGDLIRCHINGQNLVTMMLVDGPENKVLIDSTKKITDILGKLRSKKAGNKLLTYAGISVLGREIFDFLPSEPEFCSIIHAILHLIKKTGKVGAYLPRKVYWNDLGTLKQYAQAIDDIQNQKITLGEKRDFKQIPFKTSPFADQGSNRKFYRIQTPEKSQVLMLFPEKEADFKYFITIGNFLHKLKLGTPEIYDINTNEDSVLMEDLGDESLYKTVQPFLTDMKRKEMAGEISASLKLEKVYKQVISWLIKFQIQGTAALKHEQESIVRFFDYDYLRWETDYFRENFLHRHLGLKKRDMSCLDEEFHILAKAVLKQPQLLIHRDFQSQNIVLKDDKVRIVDFQGARIGPVCYDLMALLKDSYIEIPPKLQHSLMEYYLKEFNGHAKKDMEITPENFAEYTVTAGLQRNMQALGAFVFLSLVKGKKQYEKYIPLGLKHLKNGLETLRTIESYKISLSNLTKIVEGL